MNYMGKRWTVEEENFLLNNHDKMTYKELANKLGKSISSVRSKAVNYFGLFKREKNKNICVNNIENLLKNAELMEPKVCIANLKKINIENAEKVYKNWRKKYINTSNL